MFVAFPFGKPVSTPDQVRGRLFPGNALSTLKRTPAEAGALVFSSRRLRAYCCAGACCCGSGSWACVLPIGAEATSLVHTSWNTTRPSWVYSLVKQVQRG